MKSLSKFSKEDPKMTYGGTQQLNGSIRAYKAYQEKTGEDCTAKIAELERLRDKLIEENRIT